MPSVIYGLHPVLETLKAGKRGIEKIYLARGDALDPHVMAQLHDAKIPVIQVSVQEPSFRPEHVGVPDNSHVIPTGGPVGPVAVSVHVEKDLGIDPLD